MKNYAFSSYSRRELRHALKRADKNIFEDCIRFIEDDKMAFNSGYTKELIWDNVTRYDLHDKHIRRLEKSVENYLTRPMSREFKYMCQTMARIATDTFWQKIRTISNSDNPRIQINAYCLLAYAEGEYAGEKRRLELRCIKSDFRRFRRSRYGRRYLDID